MNNILRFSYLSILNVSQVFPRYSTFANKISDYNFFGTHLLSLSELAICLGFSMLMFVWIELEKLFHRWFFTRRA